MPGTAVQELLRILRREKRHGVRNIWLSTVNQEAMQRLAAGLPAGLRKTPLPPAESRQQPAGVFPAHQTAGPQSPADGTPVLPSAPKAVPVPPAAAAASQAPRVSSVSQAQKRAPITGDSEMCAGMDYQTLCNAVKNCSLCRLCRQTPHGLIGEGVPGSRLMFIGGHASSLDPETPAGIMLTKIITAMMKMQRGGDDPAAGVYVTSVLKCSASGISLTDSREVKCCMGYLQRQIELIHPQFIVLLGALPMRCLLGLVNIQKYHGQWFKYMGIPVLPVYEPEYILRFRNQNSFFMKYKREIWNDLKQLMPKLKTQP